MAGLIDFLHTLTDCRMSELTPLSIRGEPLGALTPVWRERVLALPYFHAVVDGVALGEAFQGYNDISAVLMRVARQWRDSGVLTGWRDENFTAHDLDGRPCFELERAAFRAFGLQSRAVHINGLVRNADGSWCMWVARRSPLKSVEPDKLDNLTGGGVAAGETLKAALLREGQEEAGLAPVWLSPLSALAPVFACRHVRRGLHREWLYPHDLWLPAGLVPHNTDGEVSEFVLMTPEEVLTALLDGRFMADAALVAADCLARHEGLGADSPDVLRLLHPPHLAGFTV